MRASEVVYVNAKCSRAHILILSKLAVTAIITGRANRSLGAAVGLSGRMHTTGLSGCAEHIK